MTLAVTNPDDFQKGLSEVTNIQNICKKLMETPHYRKLGEEGVHVVLAKAKALGIHPFEALNGGFHVVNGKVGMSTEMMAALVRSKGHSITKDPKSNNELCILHGKRADNGDTWTVQFTRADAEAAGLWNSTTWKKYPAIMLYNRAMSALFRQLFADLSIGAGYVPDELEEITRTGEYKVTQDKPLELVESEIIQPEKPKVETITFEQADELAALLNSCSEDYIKKMWDGLAKLLPPINDLKQLPANLFDRLKLAAIKNQIKKPIEEEVIAVRE